MKEEIVKLREELVANSKDEMLCRSLLDKLSEAVCDEHDKEHLFVIRKGEVEEKKDLDFMAIYKLHGGSVVRFKGGMDVYLDNKIISAQQAIDLFMQKMPEDEKERETVEAAQMAVRYIFQLPMFVFSSPETTYGIAEMATRYMLYLQRMGQVPVAETDNPEYDKFILQINEMVENFSKGLEEQGLEYERRMGYGKKSESESKDNGKAEA